MNLLKLAFKNITRNLYEYILFIATLSISVTIYFSFIAFNPSSVTLKTDVNLQYTLILQIAAQFIFVFLVIFSWYCNSFFMSKRKKDIGVYLILGMRKYQIALMLFFELLIIGFLSISLGIFLGILFLKLFSMFIFSLESIDTSLVKFFIPYSAIWRTLVTFFILFSVLSIFSYIKLWKTKIIGIFNKKIPKKKKGLFLFLFSIVSLVMMFYGYKLAITSNSNRLIENLIIAVFLVLIATYLFFSATLHMYIKLKRKNKFFYYRDLNMFTYSNMESKIRDNSKSLATITILLTTALIIVITISSMFVKVSKYSSYDSSYFIAYINHEDNEKVIIDDFINTNLQNSKVESVTSVPSIKTSVTEKNFYSMEQVHDKLPLRIVSYSSLDKLNSNSNNKVSMPKKPNDNECIYITEGVSLNEHLAQQSASILFYDLNEYKKVIDAIANSFIPSNLIGTFIVVSDSEFTRLSQNNKINTLECIQVTNPDNAKFLSENINSLYSTLNKNFTFAVKNSYGTTDIKAFSYVVFTGLIIAVVLLMCTANIIFFKQLSNAEDIKESYKLLKVLGAEKNLMLKNVRKESRLIFFCPLIMSIFHSIAALTMFRNSFFTKNLAPTVMSVILFILVYLIYYLMTVDIYFKIIDKQT